MDREHPSCDLRLLLSFWLELSLLLTVRVALLLKDCALCIAVAAPLEGCGGSDFGDLASCVGESCGADLSRMGSDLDGYDFEASLERVGSGRPNRSLLTEALL